MKKIKIDGQEENVVEQVEEIVIEKKVVDEKVKKPKWSLKKKLMVGGGVVVGLLLGALAFTSKSKNNAGEDSVDYFNKDTDVTTDCSNDETTESNDLNITSF